MSSRSPAESVTVFGEVLVMIHRGPLVTLRTFPFSFHRHLALLLRCNRQ